MGLMSFGHATQCGNVALRSLGAMPDIAVHPRRRLATRTSAAVHERSSLGTWLDEPDKGTGSARANALPNVTPADLDARKFKQHWSVDLWRDFDSSAWLRGATGSADSPAAVRLESFAATLREVFGTAGVLSSAQAAQYWAYHVVRMGFFAVQAVVALLATRSAAGSNSEVQGRAEFMLRRGFQGPLLESFLTFYQDYENIKEGKYGLPWDMTTPRHRQFNPLFMLRRGAAFVQEAADTLRRRTAGQPDELWLKSAYLPSYAQSTFHYQTDGWQSQRSAQIYESSTETLFLGRQDAMQRSTLVHMASFMAGRDASSVRALEVAAGTGRFATFVKDEYAQMDLTLSDLSPFYLAEARRNLAYWKRMRAPNAQLGGVDGNGVSFLQTAAESLAVPDESFDLVYCVYLFHELPADVRRTAAAEMARVVKPGGMVILTDSGQLGDRRALDRTLGNFGDFNEPHYREYIAEDLGGMFEAAGLMCDTKVVCSTSKSLSFRKLDTRLFSETGDAELDE